MIKRRKNILAEATATCKDLQLRNRYTLFEDKSKKKWVGGGEVGAGHKIGRIQRGMGITLGFISQSKESTERSHWRCVVIFK